MPSRRSLRRRWRSATPSVREGRVLGARVAHGAAVRKPRRDADAISCRARPRAVRRRVGRSRPVRPAGLRHRAPRLRRRRWLGGGVAALACRGGSRQCRVHGVVGGLPRLPAWLFAAFGGAGEVAAPQPHARSRCAGAAVRDGLLQRAATAPRRRLALTAAIVVAIVVIHALAQPLRAALDIGVVLGLTWGLASFLISLKRAFAAPGYPTSPQVASAEAASNR